MIPGSATALRSMRENLSRCLSRDLIHAFKHAFFRRQYGCITRKVTVIQNTIPARNPAIQNKREITIGRYPFTIVSPRQMQMCSVRDTAFTGWMPNAITGIHVRIWLHTVCVFQRAYKAPSNRFVRNRHYPNPAPQPHLPHG